MSRDKGYDPYNSSPVGPLTLDFETFSSAPVDANEYTANRQISVSALVMKWAPVLDTRAIHDYDPERYRK